MMPPAHGGPPQAMEIVTREPRGRLGTFAVGSVAISAILARHPDLVRMERAEDFVPLSFARERAGGLLTPEGRIGFGWMARDRPSSGLNGHAAANARRGADLVVRAAGVVRRVREILDFPLERPKPETAFDAH